MQSGDRGDALSQELDDSSVLKNHLNNEFRSTIFRIISLIITWFVGLWAISILIEIQPLIDQIGMPGTILFALMFPILLIVAWGAADYQRRTEEEGGIEDGILEEERVSSVIDQIIENVSVDPLAKEIDSEGGVLYTTRGKDPKGVAIGGGADTFDSGMPLIDGMQMRKEHEGLEAELERSVKIKVEADEKAAKTAQESWENAEQNDQELIEAGMERLGDLVGSGHFGGPMLSDSKEIDESP